MTAEIPTTQSIPKGEKKEYASNVKRWVGMMESAQAADSAKNTEVESDSEPASELDAAVN
jgi:murein DD-endopeptidase